MYTLAVVFSYNSLKEEEFLSTAVIQSSPVQLRHPSAQTWEVLPCTSVKEARDGLEDHQRAYHHSEYKLDGSEPVNPNTGAKVHFAAFCVQRDCRHSWVVPIKWDVVIN